ncbi:MAG: hypothetical protein HY647_12190 [Acidobacteria bacterium]|nr:hypothetical protein [Acidobacteriota bacterium]
MAELTELALWEQIFVKAYPFRRARWPATAPVKPLAVARIALITTAGLHLAEQEPFDTSIKGGDCSYRWIPAEVSLTELQMTHRSHAFDRQGVDQDRNLCFPLDRFREFEAEDVTGSLNHRHLSLMGSITAPGRLLRQTAPEVARELKRDQVDLAFLVPV